MHVLTFDPLAKKTMIAAVQANVKVCVARLTKKTSLRLRIWDAYMMTTTERREPNNGYLGTHCSAGTPRPSKSGSPTTIDLVDHRLPRAASP